MSTHVRSSIYVSGSAHGKGDLEHLHSSMVLWKIGGAVEVEKFYAGSMVNGKVSSMSERKLSQLEVCVFWWPS